MRKSFLPIVLFSSLIVGFLAWQYTYWPIQERIACSFEFKPGSRLFPEARLSGAVSQSLSWLQPKGRYPLAGLPPGDYILKASLVLPNEMSPEDNPLRLQVKEDLSPLALDEHGPLVGTTYQKVKCRTPVLIGEPETLCLVNSSEEVPVGLLSLRLRNFGVYDKKLGYLVFRSSFPEDAYSSARTNVVFSLSWAAVFFVVSIMLRNDIPPKRRKEFAFWVSTPSLVLFAFGFCVSTFSRFLVVMTPGGLALFTLVPLGLGWVLLARKKVAFRRQRIAKWLRNHLGRFQASGKLARRRAAITIVVLISACIGILATSASLDFADLWCDEVIYATVIDEMCQNGNFITPYEGGTPFFHKPPFGVFWPSIPIVKWFGLSPLTVRLVPWLYACGIVGLCYFAGYRAGGHLVGMGACAIVLTTSFFILHATSCMFETALAFWMLLTVLLVAHPGKVTKTSALLVGVFAGLAIMSKGAAAAPLLIWFVLFVLFFRRKQWATLSAFVPFAMALSVVALPWHLYTYWRFGDMFVSQYWNYHVWDRYAQGIEQPARGGWFYFDSLIRYAKPWVFLYPVSLFYLWKKRDRTYPLPALFTFAAIVLVVFCSAKTKLSQYIYPVLPCFSVLTAYLLYRIIPKPLFSVVYIVPLLAIGVADQVEDWKDQKQPDTEIASFLDERWENRTPALCSKVYRSDTISLASQRPLRGATLDDLRPESPLSRCAPFVVGNEDIDRWREALAKWRFEMVYNNRRARIFSLPDDVTQEGRFAIETPKFEIEFVDITWHYGWNRPFALTNDGGIWTCDDRRATMLCTQLPGVNRLLPAVKIMPLNGKDIAVLHATGDLAILAGKGGEMIPHFDFEKQVQLWPQFIASCRLRAVDCSLETNRLERSTLLTSDGRVWENGRDPQLVPRYGSWGDAVALVAKYPGDFWLAAYSQGGIGAFPGIGLGAERVLCLYRGKVSWDSWVVDGSFLNDNRLCLLDTAGGIRTLGPGNPLEHQQVWVDEPRVAFCVEPLENGPRFWILDRLGNITH